MSRLGELVKRYKRALTVLGTPMEEMQIAVRMARQTSLETLETVVTTAELRALQHTERGLDE